MRKISLKKRFRKQVNIITTNLRILIRTLSQQVLLLSFPKLGRKHAIKMGFPNSVRRSIHRNGRFNKAFCQDQSQNYEAGTQALRKCFSGRKSADFFKRCFKTSILYRETRLLYGKH